MKSGFSGGLFRHGGPEHLQERLEMAASGADVADRDAERVPAPVQVCKRGPVVGPEPDPVVVIAFQLVCVLVLERIIVIQSRKLKDGAKVTYDKEVTK